MCYSSRWISKKNVLLSLTAVVCCVCVNFCWTSLILNRWRCVACLAWGKKTKKNRGGCLPALKRFSGGGGGKYHYTAWDARYIFCKKAKHMHHIWFSMLNLMLCIYCMLSLMPFVVYVTLFCNWIQWRTFENNTSLSYKNHLPVNHQKRWQSSILFFSSCNRLKVISDIFWWDVSWYIRYVTWFLVCLCLKYREKFPFIQRHKSNCCL